MKRTTGLLVAVLVLFSACNKKNDTTPLSGMASLDSRLYFNQETQNYYLFGFDFDKAKSVRFEFFVSGEGTDLILSPTATLDGGYFTCPGNDEAFFLAESFDDISAAQAYFNDLKTFTPHSFGEWANPLLPNQVWIVKTIEDTYAKIWIQSVEVLNDNDGDYVKVSFAWVYQPDGSMTFPE